MEGANHKSELYGDVYDENILKHLFIGNLEIYKKLLKYTKNRSSKAFKVVKLGRRPFDKTPDGYKKLLLKNNHPFNNFKLMESNFSCEEKMGFLTKVLKSSHLIHN